MKQFCSILALFALLFTTSCDKEPEIPPTILLKTAAGYLSADATVAPATALKAGIIIDKVEDELIALNVSVSYDGSVTTETKQKIDITGDPAQFTQDINFQTRNQPGTEKWYFTVTDSDGNTAQASLNLKVE